ncbi:MAG: hypothetical protein RL362_955, partial [Bacteroidota bacterium]
MIDKIGGLSPLFFYPFVSYLFTLNDVQSRWDSLTARAQKIHCPAIKYSL